MLGGTMLVTNLDTALRDIAAAIESIEHLPPAWIAMTSAKPLQRSQQWNVSYT
jgi:hypothetical protein